MGTDIPTPINPQIDAAILERASWSLDQLSRWISESRASGGDYKGKVDELEKWVSAVEAWQRKTPSKMTEDERVFWSRLIPAWIRKGEGLRDDPIAAEFNQILRENIEVPIAEQREIQRQIDQWVVRHGQLFVQVSARSRQLANYIASAPSGRIALMPNAPHHQQTASRKSLTSFTGALDTTVKPIAKQSADFDKWRFLDARVSFLLAAERFVGFVQFVDAAMSGLHAELARPTRVAPPIEGDVNAAAVDDPLSLALTDAKALKPERGNRDEVVEKLEQWNKLMIESDRAPTRSGDRQRLFRELRGRTNSHLAALLDLAEGDLSDFTRQLLESGAAEPKSLKARISKLRDNLNDARRRLSRISALTQPLTAHRNRAEKLTGEYDSFDKRLSEKEPR